MKQTHWLIRFGNQLIGLPLAVVVVIFALSNRHAVTLTFWPLPGDVTMPVYLLALIILVLGFVAGGIVSWLSAGRQRRRVREAETKARSLGRELAMIEKDQEQA